MGVPRTRVERIAIETTGITADTALRLGKALGTSAQLWLNLQNRYDMETVERAIGKQLAPYFARECGMTGAALYRLK